MKRILGLLFTMQVLASCSSTEMLFVKPKYSITNEILTPIEGDIYRERLLLDTRMLATGTMVITLDRYRQNEMTYYAFCAEQYSQKWIFIDTFKIKIDSSLFKLTDDKSLREVRDGGTVFESAHFLIDPELRNLIVDSKNIIFECHGDPVIVSPEGVAAIKAFLL